MILADSGTLDIFYPLIIVAGVILILVIFDFFLKKKNCKKGLSTDYELFFVVCVFIGVIFACLFQNLYDFIENPSTYKWNFGLTFFGGLFGGVATFFIGYYLVMRRKYPYAWPYIVSIVGGMIPLAHGIGRLGCVIDGCCYGKVIEEGSPFYWLGMVFSTTNGQKVYPTQLWESIFLILLSLGLIILAFKKETLLTVPIYFMSYGIFRFLIEFIRDDHRGSFVPGLTPSQFWAVCLFIGGVGYLLYLILAKRVFIKDWPHYEEMLKTTEKENPSK